MAKEKKCERCGRVYKVYPSTLESRFCSRECRNSKLSKTCERCGSEFPIEPNRAKTARFCSRACHYGTRINKSCEQCGKTYQVTSSQAASSRYCSLACTRTRVKKQCQRCAKGYEVKKHEAERSRYCSRACANGERITLTCHYCKKEYQKSRCLSGKSRFCSRPCQYNWKSENERGVNNKAWRGGMRQLRARVMSTREYKNWRKQVLTRDQRTCQQCGSKRHLHAHHVLFLSTHPELMFDVDNGLTLCHPCHDNLHAEAGRIDGDGRLRRYIKKIGWRPDLLTAPQPSKEPRPCEFCSSIFKPSHPNARHCSIRCRDNKALAKRRVRNVKSPRACSTCGVEFTPPRHDKARFCSAHCRSVEECAKKREATRSRPPILRPEQRCAYCLKGFNPKSSHARFCCSECKCRWQYDRLKETQVAQ